MVKRGVCVRDRRKKFRQADSPFDNQKKVSK